MVPASLEEQWLTFFSASIKFPVESEAVVDEIQLKQCFFCLTRNMKDLELKDLKGIVQPFKFGRVTRPIRSGIINWRPDKFFL